MMTAKRKEAIGQAVFAAAGAVCVTAVAAIFAFLIVRSIPAFGKIGILNFLGGTTWAPDRLDTYAGALSGSYGVLPMIAGTFAGTAGAMLVGGFLGYFTAVFLVFWCPARLRGVFSAVIDLLAGIPSVVYGFFGIAFLLPLLSELAPNNGSGLAAVSLILGVMVLPTVVSLSRVALEAVPHSLYEGSVALGATHTETVFRVISPAARSGIRASFVLAIGRAMGETMAVVMVAGNAAAFPRGLFSSFRVLTANIVMEMGYAGEVQEGALIATGVVLLLLILAVNLVFGLTSGRIVRRATEKNTSRRGGMTLLPPKLLRGFAIASGVLTGGVLVLLIGFVLIRGVPVLVRDPSILYGRFEFGSSDITVLPALVTTLWAVVLSLAFAVPVGIMTAIWLHEYAPRNGLATRVIRGAIDLLAGVPSIVYGLFGMIAFVPLFGGSGSILAGSLTVSLMLLPVVRSTEESLRAVPDALREGSLALGAGKLRTVFRVVLPSALPGILSAVILSMGRVIGESAPLLYTMGSVIKAVPHGIFDSGATLAVALWQLSGEGWYINEAYATAVILVVLVLLLNFIARLCAARLGKRMKGV